MWSNAGHCVKLGKNADGGQLQGANLECQRHRSACFGMSWGFYTRVVVFFFPYNPPPPPTPTNPPARPITKILISVHFGSVWLRLAPGLFQVRFGFVSGPFGWGRGVGSGRGASVRGKNITILGNEKSAQSFLA